MAIVLGYLLKALLLPPAGNLLIAALGAWIRRHHPRTGAFVIGVALWSLLLLMFPPVARLLATPLEPAQVFDVTQGAAGAEAIVVLGGGLNPDAVEYAGVPSLHSRTSERLQYGVFLHRLLELPIAVLGGTIRADLPPESLVMQDILLRDFHVTPRWVEIDSRNTAENALRARALLPVNRILLVTHALHMWRAKAMFEAVGFEVVPAAVGFRGGFRWADATLFDFLPHVQALVLSHDALHEYVGGLWYRWHYRDVTRPR